MTPETSTLVLNLADIPVRVTLRGHAWTTAVLERFGAFVDRSVEPSSQVQNNRNDPIYDLVVHVDRTMSDLPQPEQVPWPGCFGVQRSDGAFHFRRLGLEMTFDPSSRRGEAHLAIVTDHRRPFADPFVFSLDTLLRTLLSIVLPRYDGLLLHASGYGDERGAVVFAGVSGSGKTTTARKMPRAHVLSDDQVAIRRRAGRWVAHALPFVGEYQEPTQPRSAPLRRFLLLAKGTDGYRRTSLRPSVALARTMECVVHFVHGHRESARLLDLALQLVNDVPVERLEIGLQQPLDCLLTEVLT